MAKGYFTLVLHAHLPYIRHAESDRVLEERWYFEAMTESYLPLLQVFQGLWRDGVDFKATLSVSPTLLTMFLDELMRQRYTRHLKKVQELAALEVARTQADPAFHALAIAYQNRFREIADLYQSLDGNVVAALRELQDAGFLEIITSAATHAFLPLVESREAALAQVKTAVALHASCFGRPPKGIWLPECGYAPHLDEILSACEISYFFVDEHALSQADPQPVFGTCCPVLTPNHIAAFGRDGESSKQVWSAQDGYPGDYNYREYYRDIGFDLPMEMIKDFIHPGGIRIHTGFKYFRVTGRDEHKEPYDFVRARDKAAEHAGHFMFHRERQVEYWGDRIGRKPVIIAPFDAELFGHWWYEGPVWIDMLFRKMHFDQDTIKPILPSEYLSLYADFQVCKLSMSSWGRAGYADVWLRGENDWIYPALHMTERRMIALADRYAKRSTIADWEQRALRQAARELMLAQASDWAFIMDAKTTVDYAVRRTKQHINRFSQLHEMLCSGQAQEARLAQLETLDAVFPNVDFTNYQRDISAPLQSNGVGTSILMLSWEYPPAMIGGLSRHVFGLSRQMARLGFDVHIITAALEAPPGYECEEGVHVHRVRVQKPAGEWFIHWVLQMNLAMIAKARRIIDKGQRFSVLHAHDWLVSDAAKALKDLYGLPLIATIHATEHGRNHGIRTELQQTIHGCEWELTYEASRVIVCSEYMRGEVSDVFQLPAGKVDVIVNGIDLDQVQVAAARGQCTRGQNGHPVILFVGRIVREKGVQVLLDAVPEILRKFPAAQFLIAGKGPMLDELRTQAHHLGIADSVSFLGFISDEERNRLYSVANVCVFPSLYEPFGIVALEAMAMRTPVVVSDTGGLREVVVHQQNGLTCYAGVAQSLADQVIQLLGEPVLADRLCDQAYEMVRLQYGWDTVARRTVDVYHRKIDHCDKHEEANSI